MTMYIIIFLKQIIFRSITKKNILRASLEMPKNSPWDTLKSTLREFENEIKEGFFTLSSIYISLSFFTSRSRTIYNFHSFLLLLLHHTITFPVYPTQYNSLFNALF